MIKILHLPLKSPLSSTHQSILQRPLGLLSRRLKLSSASHLPTPLLGASPLSPILRALFHALPCLWVESLIAPNCLSHITQQAVHQAIISSFFEWIWLKRRLILDLRTEGCTRILTVPKPGLGDRRVREDNSLCPGGWVRADIRISY